MGPRSSKPVEMPTGTMGEHKAHLTIIEEMGLRRFELRTSRFLNLMAYQYRILSDRALHQAKLQALIKGRTTRALKEFLSIFRVELVIP